MALQTFVNFLVLNENGNARVRFFPVNTWLPEKYVRNGPGVCNLDDRMKHTDVEYHERLHHGCALRLVAC